ncbi:hypothetical protein QJ48_13510 [Paenibacillus sp. A3]|nr:hypothetical protein QJ48_13510 [Paenibacillus sp. A3]
MHINLVDFDQVLFYTREALTKAYQEAFRIHGFVISEQQLIEIEGQSIVQLFDNLNIHDEHLRSEIRRFKKENYKTYFKYIIPNIDLLSLPNKVIVSNASSEDIADILTYYNITDVMGIIGRDKVKKLKPHPDPYLQAMNSFPATSYTIYEDSDTGLAAAKAAMQSVEYKHKINIVKVDLQITEFKGGSGQLIRKLNNKIDKITTTNSALLTLKRNKVPVPEIYFSNDEKIIMEYVEGDLLYNQYTNEKHFKKLMELQGNIRKIHYINGCSTTTYIERLKDHSKYFSADPELTYIFNYCCKSLLEHQELFNNERSFCHGDFTLSNIIVKDDKLVVIDPNINDNAMSSWLLDISKLLQSTRGYEYIFGISKNENRPELIKLRKSIMTSLSPELIPLVETLELSHWLRMLRYKKEIGHNDFIKARDITIEILKELESETWQTQLLY